MPPLTPRAADEIRYIARLYVQRVHAVMLRGHKKPKWKSLYFPSFLVSRLRWRSEWYGMKLVFPKCGTLACATSEGWEHTIWIFWLNFEHLPGASLFAYHSLRRAFAPRPAGDGSDCSPSHSTVKYALSSGETPRKCIKIKCCASCHPFVCFFGAIFALFFVFSVSLRLCEETEYMSSCRYMFSLLFLWAKRTFYVLYLPQSQPVYHRWRWAWIIFHLNLFSNLMVGVPIARSEHWRNCSQRRK